MENYFGCPVLTNQRYILLWRYVHVMHWDQSEYPQRRGHKPPEIHNIYEHEPQTTSPDTASNSRLEAAEEGELDYRQQAGGAGLRSSACAVCACEKAQ